MNRLLLAIGVGVLCIPMVFVAWLLLATKVPKMDSVTMKMPAAMRSMVADLVAGPGDKESVQRALKLDPDVVRRASVQQAALHGPGTKSVSVTGVPYTLNGRHIDVTKFANMGSRDEAAGDYCAAEDDYANASFEVSGDDSAYIYPEQMGKSAWLCGHVANARKSFESAVAKQQRFLENEDITDAETTEVKDDMLRDHEWLVLVYTHQHETALAKQACSQAHPEWKSCACKVDGKGNNIACTAG